MIAKTLVISRKAKHISDSERCGAEQIALHAQTVAVATGYLDDRFQPEFDQYTPCSNAGHTYNGGLVVSDVDCVHNPAQQSGFLLHFTPLPSLWRAKFPGYNELACTN